jgi:hypothetical protein
VRLRHRQRLNHLPQAELEDVLCEMNVLEQVGNVAPAAGSGQVLRVRQNNLSMHKCPGYECQSIGTLAIGTKVTLLGDRDTSTGEEWCRVRAGTREGWVGRYYLE